MRILNLIKICFVSLILIAFPALALFPDLPLFVGIILIVLGSLGFAAAFIGNGVYLYRYRRNLLKIPLEEYQKKLTDYKVETQKNTENAIKRVHKTVLRAKFYSLGLIVCYLFIGAGLSVLFKNIFGLDASIGYSLIGWIFLYLLLCVDPILTLIITPNKEFTGADGTPLPSKDYPVLYDLAKKAAEATGYRGNYILFVGNSPTGSISVKKVGGGIVITLSSVELGYLTKEELYNVLLHEFTHSINKDTDWLSAFNTANYRFSTSNRFLPFMKQGLYGAVAEHVSDALERLQTYSSLVCEQRADKAVLTLGNPQAFINAVSKSAFYNCFFLFPRKELAHDFYQSETPSTDYYKRVLTLFDEMLPKLVETFRPAVLRTLPTNIDSHPTLSMRMEACGIQDFSVFDRETDEDYQKEVETLLTLNGKEELKDFDWKSAHQIRYVIRNERIEEYEKKRTSGDAIDGYLEFAALDAYCFTDVEKAMKVADEILSKDAENLNAAVLKARFYSLILGDDEKAVALMEPLIQYYSDAYPQIYSEYTQAVFRTGDKEKVAEFRAKQSEYGERVKTALLTYYRKLKPSYKTMAPCTDFPQTVLCSLKSGLARFQSILQEAYLVASSTVENAYLVCLHIAPPPKADFAVYDDTVSELYSFIYSFERKNIKLFCISEWNPKSFHAAKTTGISLI